MPVFCGVGLRVNRSHYGKQRIVFGVEDMYMFLNPPNAIGEICHIVILDVKKKVAKELSSDFFVFDLL